MAMSLEQLVSYAIDLLPSTGTIEFNAYKAKLYAAQPDGGRDAFAHMIRANLINKSLERDAGGKPKVMLSRKVV